MPRDLRILASESCQRNNFKESLQQLQWPRKRKRKRRKMEKRRRTNSQRYPESERFYANRLKNRWSWSLSGSSSNSIPRGPSGDPAFDYLRVHTPLYTAILTYSGAVSVNQRQKSVKSACTRPRPFRSWLSCLVPQSSANICRHNCLGQG